GGLRFRYVGFSGWRQSTGHRSSVSWAAVVQSAECGGLAGRARLDQHLGAAQSFYLRKSPDYGAPRSWPADGRPPNALSNGAADRQKSEEGGEVVSFAPRTARSGWRDDTNADRLPSEGRRGKRRGLSAQRRNPRQEGARIDSPDHVPVGVSAELRSSLCRLR